VRLCASSAALEQLSLEATLIDDSIGEWLRAAERLARTRLEQHACERFSDCFPATRLPTRNALAYRFQSLRCVDRTHYTNEEALKESTCSRRRLPMTGLQRLKIAAPRSCKSIPWSWRHHDRNFSSFFRVRPKFDDARIEDIDREVKHAIRNIGCHSIASHPRGPKRGDRRRQSRHFTNRDQIVKSVVDSVRHLGAVPFIFPAMGSHGGATAEGQAGLLAGYGITAESMGCEIRSSMETKILGTTSAGVDVHVDVNALHADHIILVNRIKPHTRIIGPYESGLVKMMLIGLGKHRGAAEYHRAMTRQRFDEIVAEAAPMILAHTHMLLGIAIVENAFDEVTHIEAIDADQILNCEPDLLELARRKMPRLPFEDADLLIIDQIGKNISGTGLDTNVVGTQDQR
jgi:hypothetical protein